MKNMLMSGNKQIETKYIFKQLNCSFLVYKYFLSGTKTYVMSHSIWKTVVDRHFYTHIHTC